MKIKNIILILTFYLLNIIKNQPILGEHYPGITCGKKNPGKEKDCIKYGTDSGMLCCYVKIKSNNTKFCTLMSMNTAKNTLNITGTKDFNDEFWSCGNKSLYLSMNFAIVLILIFLY